MLVTRPAAQADEWVQALRAQAVDAVALPLIGIAAADDAAPVLKAWCGLDAWRLIVFVSPNAAEQFFAQRPAAGPATAWPPALRAGSPGPGTTRVLVALGVPAAQIVAPADDAAQFDSESLWAQLQRFDWRGARVLVVRGDGGREWLAETLRAAGAQVELLAAYRREPPQFDAAARATLDAAVAQPAAHAWLFSSSQAIDHLLDAVPPAVDWTRATAIATHPRIAERARRAGFGRVVAAQASLAGVVACLQSIAP